MIDFSALLNWDGLRLTGEGMMMHPGLPDGWVNLIVLSVVLLSLYGILTTAGPQTERRYSLRGLPVSGKLLHRMVTRPWVLLAFRSLFVSIFLLVIISGLFGTPIPERNLATTLTWTIWWTGLIIAVFFFGSAWCAVCPWDVSATWLVRLRLWQRGNNTNSLQLKVPKQLRNIWPATLMFVVLTWLELGYGMTTSPYATALLCLVIVVLALVSQVLYERKAFCRYFCSVGRTIGFYAGLSPVAIRPVDENICLQCKTLECYHGNQTIEPCPTSLVIGRSKQNTFCTSCGACSQSCPYQNVNWGLRNIGSEAIHFIRPHWDEAWFVLVLLSLTAFHGLTMLPGWEQWVSRLAQAIGDSGQLLWSFSIGMILAMLIPMMIYAVVILLLKVAIKSEQEYKRLFALLALPLIPLAFAYHLAHNLNHLFRESIGISAVIMNPLGRDTLPLSGHELHMRHMSPLVPDAWTFAMQAGLIVLGFQLAVRILQNRAAGLPAGYDQIMVKGVMTLLLVSLTLLNVWLLMQPMVMRM
ncbi:MAG: hypothetical protein OEZ39_18830 [Gammaproteobacteria bacterium]|nr:hypothetical protein [Gammaproteobacteria bacterium]MDH5653920.1 hypothetical protein [Gammaproteobacteria bacterium]